MSGFHPVRRLIGFAAVLACAGPVAGQDLLRLTLPEAIERAQSTSQRLVELNARVDAAAAVEAGRKAADRPAFAMLGGYQRTNHVDTFEISLPGQPPRVIYPDVPDNYRARLDLLWPIYTFGRTAALERAAGAEREAAGFDLAAARADLRLEATRAFWALVTAERTREVLAHALEASDAHVGELRARLDQGLIPPNDLLSAEAQRSHQRVLALEADNLRGTAEADLRRVIGEDRRVRIEPVMPAEPKPDVDGAADAEQLLAGALTRRPERRALAIRTDASRAREDAARAEWRPQLSFAAGFDTARPNPRIFPRVELWHDSWDVAINATWTVFDGGRRRAQLAEASALTRASTARGAQFDRDLGFEVEQRRLDVLSTAAQIGAADDGVRAAVEARRVVGERFNAGVATSTEVLDADTAVLQAQLDHTRALANAELAAARLSRAIGR